MKQATVVIVAIMMMVLSLPAWSQTDTSSIRLSFGEIRDSWLYRNLDEEHRNIMLMLYTEYDDRHKDEITSYVVLFQHDQFRELGSKRLSRFRDFLQDQRIDCDTPEELLTFTDNEYVQNLVKSIYARSGKARVLMQNLHEHVFPFLGNYDYSKETLVLISLQDLINRGQTNHQVKCFFWNKLNLKR